MYADARGIRPLRARGRVPEGLRDSAGAAADAAAARPGASSGLRLRRRDIALGANSRLPRQRPRSHTDESLAIPVFRPTSYGLTWFGRPARCSAPPLHRPSASRAGGTRSCNSASQLSVSPDGTTSLSAAGGEGAWHNRGPCDRGGLRVRLRRARRRRPCAPPLLAHIESVRAPDASSWRLPPRPSVVPPAGWWRSGCFPLARATCGTRAADLAHRPPAHRDRPVPCRRLRPRGAPSRGRRHLGPPRGNVAELLTRGRARQRRPGRGPVGRGTLRRGHSTSRSCA